MKRVVEFDKNFTIPKKAKTEAETDLYSQVISDDQYDSFASPNRYGIANKTPPKRLEAEQGTSVIDYTKFPAAYYGGVLPSVEPGVQYAPEQYFPNAQVAAMPTLSSSAAVPKEVPKLGVPNRMPYNDPSLPKVLSSQFQPLYCKLCDHQLSSNAMAKLHYESKKHNKKVKQFLIDYAEETGEPLHPKAIILASKNKVEDRDPKFYHCTVCDLPLTGRLHAESHYMGKNHRRAIAGNSPAGRGHFDTHGKWVREIALKNIGVPGRDNFGLDFLSTPTAPAPALFPMKKDLNVEDLHCQLCEVAVTSDEQMALHINGQRHRKRLIQFAAGQYVPAPPAVPIVTTFPDDYAAGVDLSAFRTPSGGFYCEPCNTTVNAEIPFRQHVSSKKHKRQINSFSGPRHVADTPKAPTQKLESIMCDICNLPLTSEMQFTIHVNGQKHKKMCEEKGLNDDLGNGSRSNGSDSQQYAKYRTPSGLYYCKRCNLTIKTETQFKLHITGKKHWSKVAPATVVNTSNK